MANCQMELTVGIAWWFRIVRPVLTAGLLVAVRLGVLDTWRAVDMLMVVAKRSMTVRRAA